ncbi:O-linked N-acetylglucosamine transferase, SPINDLY family protein [Paracraurococcus lichenis]|uniref:O-linked N-acetylglucosamine transferase n=1 Tax=Paracraurococcus lichenis TaxID=3064888 RepID=A0ABT9E1T1_9PROT|nr:O-linked N-acetylglucosamine transferase [Paracraurococcus sp. LOR1-02]MDO9710126.1 O-linked N-acetylglucosamine transferase [Paracraurococcus sp. LOR1-02]
MGIAELVTRAQALAAAGQMEAAAALYRDWAARHPDDPALQVAQFNHGVLLAALGDLAGAAEAFATAIRRDPGFLPPWINLGAIHAQLGATAQAMGHWSHVTGSLAGLTGDSVTWKVTALKQMAQALEGGRLLAEAEAALRQIAELTPGTQRDVVQHWISLRQRQCAWPLLEPLAGMDRAALLRRIAPLSLANYADDPMLQLACAAAYSRREVGTPAEFRTEADFAHRIAEVPGRRLRVGYLSSDLRDHAIGHLMADMFGLHDRAGFEVFAYYCGIAAEDDTKRRIRGSVEHWRDIGPLDDEAALRLMLQDGIDILVDVNGHTRGARTKLLSRRPAPVIVNWLGYPGSMGTPYHHYIIADPVIVPEGEERWYSEKVLRLPCYQPNDRQRPLGTERAPTREEAGLPEDATVFCSFNGTQKITPFTFARWMAILREVPDSVLWLLKSCDTVDERLRARAAEAGVAPARLVFAPLAPNREHLARYALADLFLDTLPYGAHTTASDALWMGVPVLTVPGRGFQARVCASLVRAAGLPEMVCDTPEDYVRRAVDLGQDRTRLAPLRARLVAGRRGSLLFDTPRLVRSLEDLFRGMWADFAAGRLPRPDLANLDACLELGAAINHDAEETSFVADYEARWRAALARRHAFSPLPADGRFWDGAA